MYGKIIMSLKDEVIKSAVELAGGKIAPNEMMDILKEQMEKSGTLNAMSGFFDVEFDFGYVKDLKAENPDKVSKPKHDVSKEEIEALEGLIHFAVKSNAFMQMAAIADKKHGGYLPIDEALRANQLMFTCKKLVDRLKEESDHDE